ncbi:MAG: hypothetical protein IKE74_09130 [Mogibacterium sp.]|nr:hypothetical protein [Mogibacterium sp.]
MFENTKVKHKSWGLGTITSLPETDEIKCLMEVVFNDEKKKFQYPICFENFLSTENAALSERVLEDLAKFNRMQEEKPKPSFTPKPKESDKPSKKKLIARKNIAFKCNFNDGGKDDSHIGFYGVCSDEIIRNNIEKEHRDWCTQPECLCMQYYEGAISREELEEGCLEGGWVCYESQMLRDWRAFGGMCTSGTRRGEPLPLRNVQKNSLAVLTTRKPGSVEAERIIFAIFLVDEFNEGESKDGGFVSTQSKYKLTFNENECKDFLFWNYHKNENNPNNPRWGQGLFRYFNDEVALQILIDAAEIKKGTKDEALALEFLEHYSNVVKMPISMVREPQGALKTGR